MYINVHSYYSLRYGTLGIDELLEQASSFGLEALALTDINTTMGIPCFIKAALARGIRPVAGCEFRNGDSLMYICLAMNREGLKEINDLLTWRNMTGEEFPSVAPSFNNVYVVYPLGARSNGALRDNEFTGIRDREVNLLVASAYERELNKLVALQPVTFNGDADRFLHTCLRAIDHNTLITMLRSGQVAGPSEVMTDMAVLRNSFARYPQIIDNTERLMRECRIEMDFETFKNKKTFTSSFHDDKMMLERLVMEGMNDRYGADNISAKERVRHELDIVGSMGFISYFLIAWDIVRYSMSKGIYHVGRGSGANSILAYCLRITDVDPLKLNLYFERFLNPRRTSPPDFDIDYSWRDRDKIHSYIFERYGRERTALLGATTTFRGRSVRRELGKVFGLHGEEIDRLTDDPVNSLNDNDITRRIALLAQQMTGFPNMRTIHAGGVLISEEPITYHTALDLPPKGLPTSQWDMYVAEDLRFEKLDILSQRGIGHINEAVAIIRENRGEEVDIHRVDRFFSDAKIAGRLRQGEANGCFYIESPGMRGLLRKLRCDNYLSLVAASSIIRPGVASSGMMREYIYRFHNPGNFTYLHPVMEEHLAETYGVMIYQEDVIKVAHYFAGLDLAEADVLRRAMSGKYRSQAEFRRIEDKYFSNCRERGYPDTLSREVWRQTESFSGYSFSKAHSASYAVESYQSLFLKTYYPLEFMVAVINNFGGFFRTWVYFHEAGRCGAVIEPPCINNSRRETRITGDTVYIGFNHVQNLNSEVLGRVLDERQSHGGFLSLADFIDRVVVTREQLIILIRVGAFRFTGKDKATLLWEAHFLLQRTTVKVKSRSIFPVQDHHHSLPCFESSSLRDACDEMELLGFPVSMTPFDILKTSFRGEVSAAGMMDHVGSTVRMLGQLAAIKYTRTKKNELMAFGAFLDVEKNFFDTVHFPQSFIHYPFSGDGVYLLLGRIVEEFGVPSLEVAKMARMPYQTPPES